MKLLTAVKPKAQKRHTPTQAPLPTRSQAEFDAWVMDLSHLDREAAKRELLRDLAAKWSKGSDYAAEAEAAMRAADAAGDDEAYARAEDRFERAIARMFYRTAQMWWTERRPVDAVCPYCVADAVEPAFWKDPNQVSCLEHIDGVIRSEAAEQYKLWAEAGEGAAV